MSNLQRLFDRCSRCSKCKPAQTVITIRSTVYCIQTVWCLYIVEPNVQPCCCIWDNHNMYIHDANQYSSMMQFWHASDIPRCNYQYTDCFYTARCACIETICVLRRACDINTTQWMLRLIMFVFVGTFICRRPDWRRWRELLSANHPWTSNEVAPTQVP